MTKTPFYGWPRMTAYLRSQGDAVNHKRVQRLMRLMGLQAIYPKPKTSLSAPENKVYPYLLRGLAITQPNQVWSSDTHYPTRVCIRIRAQNGWLQRMLSCRAHSAHGNASWRQFATYLAG